MYNFYTENLADFGYRELEILTDTLAAWTQNGLPDGFDDSGVRPAFNTSSGYVFLVNDEYQVAMLNDNQLEIFHTLPYSGDEGFLSDLIAENEPDSLNGEDVEYIINTTESLRYELSGKWLRVTLDF